MTQVAIKDNVFEIGDKYFDRPLTIDEAAEIFGKDRITYPKAKAAKSTIHTYDKDGIWVYEENGSITQISLLFGAPFLDFHPAERFKGNIVIKEINIRNSDDFLSVVCDEKWLDEWEAEGAATLKLGNVACTMSADYETKEIEEVDFWFIN